MDESETRSAIKRLAEELLVRHGYRGMGYAEIAARLGITRANIHYHFGSKAALIDEVLADYVASTLEALRRLWTADGTGLSAKLDQMLVFSRQRYDRQRQRRAVQPWSLISACARTRTCSPSPAAPATRFSSNCAPSSPAP